MHVNSPRLHSIKDTSSCVAVNNSPLDSDAKDDEAEELHLDSKPLKNEILKQAESQRAAEKYRNFDGIHS